MLSVAIIGPGAVGTTIAYELQQSLPHTTLIGRRMQMQLKQKERILHHLLKKQRQ